MLAVKSGNAEKIIRSTGKTYKDDHIASSGVDANPAILLVTDVKVAASSQEETDLLVSVEVPNGRGRQNVVRACERRKK